MGHPTEEKWRQRQETKKNEDISKQSNVLLSISQQFEQIGKGINEGISKNSKNIVQNTAITNEVLKGISEKKVVQSDNNNANTQALLIKSIQDNARVSQILATMSLKSDSPFTSLSSAMNANDSSFRTQLNQLVTKEKASKNAENKEDQKEDSGSGPKISENFFKTIGEEAKKIWNSKLDSDPALGGFILTVTTMNKLFSEIGKWDMVIDGSSLSPIQSAISGVTQLKNFQSYKPGETLADFILSMNDPRLQKFMENSIISANAQKKITDGESPNLINVLDPNSIIVKSLVGASSIFKSFASMSNTKDGNASPIDGAIRTMTKMRNLNIASFIFDFMKEFNNPDLRKLFVPKSTPISWDKDGNPIEFEGRSAIDNIFSKTSGITSVFSGFKSIMSTLTSIGLKDAYRAWTAMKFISRIKFSKYLSTFYKDIGSLKNTPEQIKSHGEIFELMKTVTGVGDFTYKMAWEMRKFKFFVRVIRPGKTLGSFYKQFSKDMVLKTTKLKTFSRDKDGNIFASNKVVDEKAVPLESLKGIGDILNMMIELPKNAIKAKLAVKFISMMRFGKNLRALFGDLAGLMPGKSETKDLIGQFFGKENIIKAAVDANEEKKILAIPAVKIKDDPILAWTVYFAKIKELITGKGGFVGMVDSMPKFTAKGIWAVTKTRAGIAMITGTVKSIFKTISKLMKEFGADKNPEDVKKQYQSVSSSINSFADTIQEFVKKLNSIGAVKDISESFVAISSSLKTLASGVKAVVKDKKYFDEFPEVFDKVTSLITISMDSFSKMDIDEKNTYLNDEKKKVQLLKGIGAIGSSLKMIITIVKDLAKVAVLVKIATMTISGITKMVKFFGLIGKSHISINLAGKVVVNMSHSILSYAIGLTAASVILTKADFSGFVKGIVLLAVLVKFYKSIGDIKDYLRIKYASKAVMSMSLSIFTFALGISLASKMLANVNLGSLVIGLGILMLMATIYNFIGKGTNAINIVKGAFAVGLMSISIALFALSLYLSSKLLTNVGFISIAMSMLMLVGFAVIFGLMGAAWKFIIKGALVLLVMSIGIVIFAFGIKKLSEAMEGWTGEKIGMSLLVMGGILALIVGLGLPGISQFAMLGAVTLILVSASLLVAALAFKYFLDVKFPDADGQARISGTMSAILLPLAKYGILAPIIAMGAGAMILAGAAVASLAKGLKESEKVNWKSVPVESISNAITGIAKAFASVAMAGGFLGALQSLNPLSMLGVTQTPVERGIKSVLKANEALTSVAKGLREFDSNTRNLDLRDPKASPNGLPARIATVLGVVNAAFSAIGASGNTNNSIIGLVFGSDFKKSDTEVGINSVMKAGQALASVAQGIMQFDSLTKNIDLRDAKLSPNGLPARITTVLGVINKVFSDIGSSGNTNNSLIGLVFGSDFKKSDTEVGINSVLNAGKALTGIAQGLQQFESMTKNLDLRDPKKSPTGIPANIVTVLGIINKVFSDIGASGNTNNSLVGLVFGSDFKKSDVEVGIQSVQGVGKIFTEIAEGLAKWNDLKGQNIDIPTINKNIKLVLTGISSVFADIGSKKSGGFMGFGENNAVEDGIKAVRGVGTVFKDIAEGLKVWQELSKVGIKDTDFNPEKVGGLAYNIKKVIMLVSDVFGSIGKNTKESTVADILSWRPGKQQEQKAMTVTSEDVKRGIDAVSGAGNELKSIGESIKTFASFTKSIKVEKVTELMKQIILMSSDIFAQIGEGKMGNPKKVKEGIDAIKGVGNELQGIANSIKVFADLEKGGKDGKKLDLQKIKQNIKELIELSVRVIAGVGGDEGSWQMLYPGTKPPQGSFLTQGGEIIKSSVNSFKEVSGIVDVVNKIDVNKWKSQKKVMSDLSTAPILSIRELAEIYSKDKTVIDQAFTLIPDLKNQIQNIASASNAINASTVGSGPIKSLSKDFETYINVVRKANLTKVQLDSMSTIVTFFERWSKIESPFEKFTKSFKNHVEDFKQFVEILNKIDTSKLSGYNDFNRITLDIIKADGGNMTAKRDMMIEMMKSFFSEASLFVDKLNTLQTGYAAEAQAQANGQQMTANYWQQQQQAQQQQAQHQQAQANDKNLISALEKVLQDGKPLRVTVVS